ncbi:MAG: hypothetical protein U9Q16_00895 [Patescibacteria group bacterium]|nr:hypothetical protein [Patescibacteria group bacterium]
MKNKIILILLFLFVLGLFFIPDFSEAEDNKFCSVYFTFIGCPNCAYTDPEVLLQWTEKYPNFVVIEYTWEYGDWQNPNSVFFGKYSQEHKVQSSVPQIAVNKNNIRLGKIEVPKVEEDIKSARANPCLLLEGLAYFEDINLNKLSANPKIWANKRILIREDKDDWIFQWNGDPLSIDIKGNKGIDDKLAKKLLFEKDISEIIKGRNFEIVNPEKAMFSGSAFPENPDLIAYANFENAIRITISENSADPNFIDEDQFKEETDEIINLPFVGNIEIKKLSLPVFTFLIALADGFNPCAFFILTFLLASLFGLTGARKKIILVGGIFIFFSALFYFLFMALLFNVFQLGRGMIILTLIAGIVAIITGLINIKDYFFFQKGVSLTLTKTGKLKFFEKVKKLSLAKSNLALIGTATIIAGTVNLYELLCTFGFPMIYSGALVRQELPALQYYLYLGLYNIVYIIPLTIIVLIFALTLGRKNFSKIWVRRLKLVSGVMILSLGAILIFKPSLLENISAVFTTLFLAVIVSTIVIFISRKQINEQ